MKIMKVALVVVLGALPVLVLLAPLGPVPGLFIGGTEKPAPAAWGDTAQEHEIRLRVPGALPRVVIIWFVQQEGELYVVGSSGSGWVQMIGDGSPVHMRLGDDTYALDAAPVKDGWQPVLEAYVAKYRADYPDIIAGFPSLEEAEGQVSVFRLERG